MQYLAPYQSGLWLAEYLNRRCQLCHIHRSTPQAFEYDQRLFSNRLAHKFNSGLLCSHCHDSIAWQPPSFTVDIATSTSLSIQSATYYDYPIRQAIRAFKHHEDMTKLPLLIYVLRQLPRPKGCHSGNSVILPMPTTSSRLIKRGFDPVTVLSVYLSKHWQIPLWHGMQRVDSASSQQGLTRSERLTNLNDAFVMTDIPPVKRILLFDDVATTGASLQALAHTLYDQVKHAPNLSYSIDIPTTSSTVYHLSAYTLAHGSFDK